MKKGIDGLSKSPVLLGFFEASLNTYIRSNAKLRVLTKDCNYRKKSQQQNKYFLTEYQYDFIKERIYLII